MQIIVVNSFCSEFVMWKISILLHYNLGPGLSSLQWPYLPCSPTLNVVEKGGTPLLVMIAPNHGLKNWDWHLDFIYRHCTDYTEVQFGIEIEK